MGYLAIGKVSPVPRAEWESQHDYKRLDIVTFENKAYIAKRPSRGMMPQEIPNPYWLLMMEPYLTEMIGATETTDGAHGLAPTPLAGDQDKALSGSGEWKYKLQTDILHNGDRYGYLNENNEFVPFLTYEEAISEGMVGSAEPEDVRIGTTFTNHSDRALSGTMPDYSATKLIADTNESNEHTPLLRLTNASGSVIEPLISTKATGNVLVKSSVNTPIAAGTEFKTSSDLIFKARSAVDLSAISASGVKATGSVTVKSVANGGSLASGTQFKTSSGLIFKSTAAKSPTAIQPTVPAQAAAAATGTATIYHTNSGGSGIQISGYYYVDIYKNGSVAYRFKTNQGFDNSGDPPTGSYAGTITAVATGPQYNTTSTSGLSTGDSRDSLTAISASGGADEVQEQWADQYRYIYSGIPVQAENTGSNYNVSANAINSFVSTPSGTWSVANPSATTGGVNDYPDAYRYMATVPIEAASPGTEFNVSANTINSFVTTPAGTWYVNNSAATSGGNLVYPAEGEYYEVTMPTGYWKYDKGKSGVLVQAEEQTITAGTSNVTVKPSAGKALSRVIVKGTPIQAKTVTASRSQQVVKPDSGYHLSQVTVNKYPDATGTYKPTTNSSASDMGPTNNYRYVDTTAIYNAGFNSGKPVKIGSLSANRGTFNLTSYSGYKNFTSDNFLYKIDSIILTWGYASGSTNGVTYDGIVQCSAEVVNNGTSTIKPEMSYNASTGVLTVSNLQVSRTVTARGSMYYSSGGNHNHADANATVIARANVSVYLIRTGI
jgi:hypothetical protein